MAECWVGAGRHPHEHLPRVSGRRRMPAATRKVSKADHRAATAQADEAAARKGRGAARARERLQAPIAGAAQASSSHGRRLLGRLELQRVRRRQHGHAARRSVNTQTGGPRATPRLSNEQRQAEPAQQEQAEEVRGM